MLEISNHYSFANLKSWIVTKWRITLLLVKYKNINNLCFFSQAHSSLALGTAQNKSWRLYYHMSSKMKRPSAMEQSNAGRAFQNCCNNQTYKCTCTKKEDLWYNPSYIPMKARDIQTTCNSAYHYHSHVFQYYNHTRRPTSIFSCPFPQMKKHKSRVNGKIKVVSKEQTLACP